MQIKEWDRVAKDVNFSLPIDIKRIKEMIPKEASILDYGCGYGRICNILAENGYSNIVGIDSSQKMISRGLSEFPQLQLRVSQRTAIPFNDCSFDFIVLCAVLTCLLNIEQQINLVNETLRVIKPNGVIHAVEFAKSSTRKYDSNGRFMSGLDVKMKHFEQSEILDLLQKYSTINCEIIQTQTISGEAINAMSYFGKST